MSNYKEKNTAFSKHEAEVFISLEWYNDPILNRTIEDNFASSLSDDCNVLLDIGCGIGTAYNYLMPYFNKYIGVDNSLYMLKIAKRLHSEFVYMPGIAKRLHSEDDNNAPNQLFLYNIEDFFEKENCINEITHILIKNVLQFLNYEVLFALIRRNVEKDLTCQIVQTTRRKDSKDFFKLLQSLDFVKRTKHYLTREELSDIIENNTFHIIDFKEHTQTFELEKWLDYHDVNQREKYDIYKLLHKYNNNDLKEYNIEKRESIYYINRLLSIFTFTKKE